MQEINNILQLKEKLQNKVDAIEIKSLMAKHKQNSCNVKITNVFTNEDKLIIDLEITPPRVVNHVQLPISDKKFPSLTDGCFYAPYVPEKIEPIIVIDGEVTSNIKRK